MSGDSLPIAPLQPKGGGGGERPGEGQGGHAVEDGLESPKRVPEKRATRAIRERAQEGKRQLWGREHVEKWKG